MSVCMSLRKYKEVNAMQYFVSFKKLARAFLHCVLCIVFRPILF